MKAGLREFQVKDSPFIIPLGDLPAKNSILSQHVIHKFTSLLKNA